MYGRNAYQAAAKSDQAPATQSIAPTIPKAICRPTDGISGKSTPNALRPPPTTAVSIAATPTPRSKSRSPLNLFMLIPRPAGRYSGKCCRPRPAPTCRSRAGDSAIMGAVKDPFSASLEYRRRYVRDLTWFGVGLIAIGFGVLAQTHGWARLWSLLPLLVGMTMVRPAASKWLRRRG